MHIVDKQLDEYFNTINECVDAVKGHQQSLKADEIKDCIKEVKTFSVVNIQFVIWHQCSFW